jgi:8-oxo-dGTP pyrophosphatase MutT (NUDIX family)
VISHNWVDDLSVLDFVKVFQKNEPSTPHQYRKNAAVLIPILRQTNRWRVLFCHRSNTVKNHKGQVSFPGGEVEPQDSSLIETALRESQEEINLHAGDVEIIGVMPAFDTISSFYLTPVIGVVKHPIRFKPSKFEVERIFTIPLSWLADENNSEVRPYQRENGTKSNVLFFKPYRNEIVWGITAVIVHQFIEIMKKQRS